MKYLSQFCIILTFTFIGEALQWMLPIPIPASVYGLVLLFLALQKRIIRLEQIKETGDFLRSLLPLLFVAPTVGIVEHWALIQEHIISLTLLIICTTLTTFMISGRITQTLHSDRRNHA